MAVKVQEENSVWTIVHSNHIRSSCVVQPKIMRDLGKSDSTDFETSLGDLGCPCNHTSLPWVILSTLKKLADQRKTVFPELLFVIWLLPQ